MAQVNILLETHNAVVTHPQTHTTHKGTDAAVSGGEGFSCGYRNMGHSSLLRVY